MAGDGGTLTTAVSFTAPTAPARIATARHLRTFTFERVVPDPSLPCMPRIAPWSREGQQLLLLLCCFSVAKPSAFEIKQPWNQLTLEQQQILVLQGKPRARSPWQATAATAKGPGYLRPLRESADPGAPSCATQR